MSWGQAKTVVQPRVRFHEAGVSTSRAEVLSRRCKSQGHFANSPSQIQYQATVQQDDFETVVSIRPRQHTILGLKNNLCAHQGALLDEVVPVVTTSNTPIIRATRETSGFADQESVARGRTPQAVCHMRMLFSVAPIFVSIRLGQSTNPEV